MKAGSQKLLARNDGFSLVECVVALVLLMVGSLAIVGVMNFSIRSTADARKRNGAFQLAQDKSESIRNTYFKDLTAGTTTEPSILFDGITYKRVTTIVDNDTLNLASYPGAETRTITITVSTVQNPMVADTVTIVTTRATNKPGPNRTPNPTQ